MSIVTTPLRNLILLRLRPIPETTGLIVRVSRFEPSRWADVLAVGPECRDVTVGMVILVNPLIGDMIGDDILYPETSVIAYEVE